MRWRRSGAEPAVLFPLTPAGGLYSLFSLALLLLGAVRGEIVALLWGGSFFLAFLYALAGGRLYRLLLGRWLSRRPEALRCHLPYGGVFPGQDCPVEIRSDLPSWFVPGFRLRLSLPLSASGGRRLQVKALLEAGCGQRTAVLRPRRRGRYRSETARLELEDLFGFTRAVVPVPMREELLVLPHIIDETRRPPRLEPGGENRVLELTRHRRGEMLESRKYFPGDDPRRIRWKVYAHLNELFIRLGEETPPPRSRLLILLDCGRGPFRHEGLASSLLDKMVESCASLANGFLDRGAELLFAVGGDLLPHEYTLRDRLALLGRLAAIDWSTEASLPALPGADIPVLLLSSPGSPGLPPLLQALRRQDRKSFLLIQRPPAGESFRSRRPHPVSWKRLLFQDPEKGRSRPGRTRRGWERERARLEELLERDLSRYRNPPWSLADAEAL